MSSNWRNRPTTIDYVSKDVDYIISIDESGNSNLKNVIEAKQKGIDPVESEKHLTLTACLFNMKDIENIRDKVMALKNKYWENALFNYKSGERRVCFHSCDIRGKRNAFNPDIISYHTFITDLSNLISNIPMTLYSAHIDKVKHVNKYKTPRNPYDLCMTFILERIIMDIPEDSTCIIVLEARGNKEDKNLLCYLKTLLDKGNNYYPAERFRNIKGVYFNPKWCKHKEYKQSYWELEISDLCAYPIHKYFSYGIRDKAFEAILPKLAGYPSYRGRGLKDFP